MTYHIKPITPKFDAAICDIIIQVGTEFGAIGDGFGPSDQEVKAMSQHYDIANRSQYWVALLNNKVVGGCGLAAFNKHNDIAELRKLFLLPEARGLGIGKALTLESLSFARQAGYKKCYLDTLETMSTAIQMYKNMGFELLDHPLDGTLHGACDTWMLKVL
jgi:putative acetyltransferase